MRIAKPIAFFVFLFLTLSAFSQRDSIPLIIADSLKEVVIYADTGKALNRTDAQGRKQGLWEKRYPNGHLRYRGHFKDDKPYGVFKYWWESSDSLQNITYYSENGKVARSEIFYENGGVLSIGKFVNKGKDSIWIYYDENHKLIKKEQYILGKKEGKSILFYDNGNVEEIANWHNDAEDGVTQQFYPDGQLKLEMTYANGKREGLMRLFDPGESDVPRAMGYYKNDNREGKWFYRNTETGKMDTAVYKNDKLIRGGINKFTPISLDSAKMKSQQEEQDLKNRGDGSGLKNGGDR